MVPEQMQLTRITSGAWPAAIDRVSVMTAALDEHFSKIVLDISRH